MSDENQGTDEIHAGDTIPPQENLVRRQIRILRSKTEINETDLVDLADAVNETFENAETKVKALESELKTVKEKTDSIENEVKVVEEVIYDQAQRFIDSHQAKSIDYPVEKVVQTLYNERGERLGRDKFDVNAKYGMVTIRLKEYKADLGELKQAAIVYQIMDKTLGKPVGTEEKGKFKIYVSGNIIHDGEDTLITVSKPEFKERVKESLKEQGSLGVYLKLEDMMVFQKGFEPSETEKLREHLTKLNYTPKEENEEEGD